MPVDVASVVSRGRDALEWPREGLIDSSQWSCGTKNCLREKNTDLTNSLISARVKGSVGLEIQLMSLMVHRKVVKC